MLYGRIPGFGLSARGHRMAELAAASLEGRSISAVIASPLQRTQESAAPWVSRFGVELGTDPRLIEPANRFEGLNLQRDLPKSAKHWPFLLNPLWPSWGEAFFSIRSRMMAAVTDHWQLVDGGELVLVSHQLPIWMVARTVQRKPLPHDPRRRRCALSSITTLERRGDRFVEVSYTEPAADLLLGAIDTGAV